MANLEASCMNHQSRLSTGEHTLTDLPTFRPNSEKPNHSLQFVETAVNSSYNKDVENAPLMGMATHATQSSIGNPAIVGNWAFGTIFLFMGLFKLILPDSSGNIMLPVALFFGGCTQFLAGLLCLLQGKSWGGSLFMSWGAYWIGAAIRMVPNISSAFDAYTDPYDLDTANGIYFFIWAIYGFMVSLISIRIKGGNMLTTYNMFFIALNLLTEGIYNITHATSSMRVSGVASLLAAAGAYYGAVVDIFAEQGVKYWVGEYKHDDDN